MAVPEKVLIFVSIFFSACIVACLCYDVNEEIEALRAIYGDYVPYKPPKYDDIRPKRFLFGSSSSSPYCHNKLGCFSLNGDFDERPVNFNPNSRETVNTQFTLYTRTTKNVGQKLKADDVKTLSNSRFSFTRKTKFVVHGFLESTSSSWFKPFALELLKNGDYNVITVDWGSLGASKTLYTQATANTRVVAREIAYLIRTLQQTNGLNPADVHLIGHSLGAHTCGYVGKNMSAAIGRISGLDPAEPYFEGFNAGIRLDPSDAQFVDVLHSDGDSILEIVKGEGGLGSNELSGHADFFPNGGKDQPNCKNGIIKNVRLENDLYEGLRRFIGCDHDRAIRYYKESINECQFTGVVCSSYEDFENGKCPMSCKRADECNSMGFGSHKPKAAGYKKYYLHTTGDNDNFCANGFQIKVTIDQASHERAGSLAVTVTGSTGKKQIFQVNDKGDVLKPGQTYTYQVGVSTDVGDPAALEVEWTHNMAWWKVISQVCGFVGLCSDSIKIHEIELVRGYGQSYHFCGAGNTYKSGSPRLLHSSSQSCVQFASSSVIGR